MFSGFGEAWVLEKPGTKGSMIQYWVLSFSEFDQQTPSRRAGVARVHFRMPTSRDWYGRSTEHQAHRRGPHIREVESDDEGEAGHHSTEAVVEEPNDTGGYHPPEPGGGRSHHQRQPQRQGGTPFRRPLFTDPFLHGGVFGPSSLFEDAHSFSEVPSLLVGMGFGGSLMSRPVVPSEGNARFSYTCSSWTSCGSLNGPHMEHNVSVNGSSEDGHHFKESVTDERTGQTHVLRQTIGHKNFERKETRYQQQEDHKTPFMVPCGSSREPCLVEELSLSQTASESHPPSHRRGSRRIDIR